MFLLGHWKNYEELENQLSMPELVATVEAQQETERRNFKFFAALKGIDLDESDKTESDFERIKRKALGDDPDTNDIVNLKGKLAEEAGFGIGMGLGYEEEVGDDN